MPLFRTSGEIERQIDEFLDRLAETALVYRAGIEAYLAGDWEDFNTRLARIDRLESEADRLSKSVEAQLYSHSLIPDHRGDVLGLLETTDNVIDESKSSLHQFAIERPVVPDPFREGFRRLAGASAEATEALAVAVRTFFRDPAGVKDHLVRIHHWEKDADKLSDSLKRGIFAADLDLAHKTQLRYFAHTVEQVSDEAEEVADRLAIYAIKRNL